MLGEELARSPALGRYCLQQCTPTGPWPLRCLRICAAQGPRTAHTHPCLAGSTQPGAAPSLPRLANNTQAGGAHLGVEQPVVHQGTAGDAS